MTNSIEHLATEHPASKQLDQLRAGLLDDETEATLELHIQNCTQCQKDVAGWIQLTEAAGTSTQSQEQITTRLNAARRKALTSSPAKTRAFQPAFAMAASLALVVGLALWQPWLSVGPESNHMVQRENGVTPELYEDLDFYLWLAGQQESAISTTDPSISNA